MREIPPDIMEELGEIIDPSSVHGGFDGFPVQVWAKLDNCRFSERTYRERLDRAAIRGTMQKGRGLYNGRKLMLYRLSDAEKWAEVKKYIEGKT